MWTSLIAAVGALIVLALIAYSDFVSMRISNLLVLALLAVFVGLVAPFLSADELQYRLIATFVCLAVTFTMFLVGGFGAADSKALTALMPHIPSVYWGPYFYLLAFSGVLFVVFLIVIRSRLQIDKNAPEAQTGWRSWKVWRKREKVPFGVPMAVAGAAIIAVGMN